MAKIYVASSWRNQYFAEVVERLRAAWHEVYDFRNPLHGRVEFHWSDIDLDFQNRTASSIGRNWLTRGRSSSSRAT